MVVQYVLDTDHVTLYQREHPAVLQQVAIIGSNNLAITSITVEEQMRGWLGGIRKASQVSTGQAAKLSQAYTQLRIAVQFFNCLQILDYTIAAHDRFVDLRHQGSRIGTQDLRIAAICLVHQLTLVTRNQQDFAQIPGLVLENWTQ